MQSRRQFIYLLPAAGAATLLSACGQRQTEAPPASTVPAPAQPGAAIPTVQATEAPPVPAQAQADSAPTPATTPAANPATTPGPGGGAMVDEKDPQAVALGYVTDVARVDKAKFPKYEPGQVCANCQLYQGSPTAPQAGCALFAGKQVPAKAWCSGWVKRA